MKPVDFVIILVLLTLIFTAFWFFKKRRKKGCCNSCSGCHTCIHENTHTQQNPYASGNDNILTDKYKDITDNK